MCKQGHSTQLSSPEKERPRSDSLEGFFFQNKQKNFAHFNYINELHNRSNKWKNCMDKREARSCPFNMQTV